MRYKGFFATACIVVISGCTAFEDAGMTERNTFVHFFSSATDYHGIVAELDTDGGYIVSGEIRNTNGLSDALIIKTDPRGHKVWENVITNSIMNAVRPYEDGYILLGDSVQTNPGSPEVNELVNTYARLLRIDGQGSILDEHLTSGTVTRTVNNQPVKLTIDYHGNALNLDASGNIVVLGNYRVPGENQSSFVAAFDPGNLQDSLWYRSYSPQDQDYINCNALHFTGSAGLIWAQRNFTQGNVTREFFSVAHVVPGSTYRGSSLFGQNDARNHIVEDIQKSSVGFGIIGTYAETNGLNGNIYFIRTDVQGNILEESVRYIDGEDLILRDQVMEAGSATSSGSHDTGMALAALDDGFVLGGVMTSTPTVGSGGTDILLIKLDPFGNLLWKKLIGGSGDETVNSIRETPDGGLLLCGTNTVNGLSTIMLVKTDANGNVDN